MQVLLGIRPASEGGVIRPQKRARVKSKRKLALAALGLVAVLFVAVAFLSLKPDSPKDVTNAYLGALAAQDYDRAYQLLAEGAKNSIRASDGLRRTALGAQFESGRVDRFEIREVKTDGDRARVEVSLYRGDRDTGVVTSLRKEKSHWRVEL